MTNHLHYGDNLTVLRTSIASESVDLVYLDPPFNSNASYNVLFKAPDGVSSAAQIEAFDDTWHWNDSAEAAFTDVLRSGNGAAAEMLRAMRGFLGENDMMAYLAMMAARLLELHRVLKPTGSLYLHCDPTASHYLKILLDAVFGKNGFNSEVIWKRSSAHSDTKQGKKNHGHIHDTILFYTKGKKWTWNEVFTPYGEEYTGRDYALVDEETGRRFRRGDLTAAKGGGDTSYEWRVMKPANEKVRWVADLEREFESPKDGWEYRSVFPYNGRFWAYSQANMRQFAVDGRLRHTFDGMPEYKRFLDEMPGIPLQDVWTDIQPLSTGTAERLGYPTQKPVALLERILNASSNPGDVVLDPFCGCGTTVHAAEKLGRAWIGIDVTHLAIGLIEKRLRSAFPGVQFLTHGVPQDLSGAKDLAARGKYHEFEKWALSLIDAQPGNLGKKGADRGLDGRLYYGKTGHGVVSVKAGENVGVSMIRDLKGVIEREKAGIGVFLTLTEPTKPMITEAASAGLHEEPGFAPVPRLQIVTIEQAMALRERAVHLPARREDTFKRAAREEDPTRQRALDL